MPIASSRWIKSSRAASYVLLLLGCSDASEPVDAGSVGVAAGAGGEDAAADASGAGASSGSAGSMTPVAGGAGGSGAGTTGIGTGGTTAGAGAAAQGGASASDGGDGDRDGDGGDDNEGNVRDTNWIEQCGGVRQGGRCVGHVFEWCDYFTRTLQQRDCEALGMRCDANLQSGEEDTRGCVGGACELVDEHCEGELLYHCHLGTMIAIDCHRQNGPSSTCELTEEGYGRCARAEPCDEPLAAWCDAELRVSCDEEGLLGFTDCKGRTPSGQCVADGDNVHCDPPLTE